jgi:hypothetical protein
LSWSDLWSADRLRHPKEDRDTLPPTACRQDFAFGERLSPSPEAAFGDLLTAEIRGCPERELASGQKVAITTHGPGGREREPAGDSGSVPPPIVGVCINRRDHG